VNDEPGEQLGSTLSTLVQELAAERRRVVLLERENRALRAQLEAAEASLREDDACAGVR